MQPHAFGQRRVGADADRHHHQIGGHLGAVFELHPADAAAVFTVLAGHQRCRLRADQEFHASVFERLLQQLAGDIVELALHQP